MYSTLVSGLLILIMFSKALLLHAQMEMPGSIGKNSKMTECSSIIRTELGTLEKLSPSSKYLIYRADTTKNGYKYKFDETEAICSQAGSLEVAEIRHIYDLASLEENLDVEVWLGVNHREQVGNFVHGNGGDPIQFQSFFGPEPNNGRDSERCVMLRAGNGFLAMEDQNCGYHLNVLCQFKKGSSCYMQSAEETASIKGPDSIDVKLLPGSTHETKFFVSVEQKTWAVAQDVCMRNGMNLIKMDNNSRLQHLSEQIKKHITEIHLHPFTQFWTAGSFSDDWGLEWKLGEELNEMATDLAAHRWGYVQWKVEEPFDQTNSGTEKCLDVSFENTELSTMGSHAPIWRASNCLLPKFFICEKNIPAIPLGALHDESRVSAANNDSSSEDITDTATETVHCAKTDNTAEPTVEPTITFEMTLSGHTSREDLVKFMIFNVENDLSSGNMPFEVKPEIIAWRKTVIDLLFQIGMKAIATEYVDFGLLNIAKIVNLMYQNAAAAAAAATESVSNNNNTNEPMWKKEFIPHLKKCLNETQQMNYLGVGYEISQFLVEGEVPLPIKVYSESADLIELDYAVDILWFLFSFSFMNCYHLPRDRMTFASDFHIYFVKDFIEGLEERWLLHSSKNPEETNLGLKLDYRIALGDVDFDLSMKNLRHVVTSIYQMKERLDLEPVRPLDMFKIASSGALSEVNKRTANLLYPESNNV